ncbi:hypothetical protein U1Q18_032208 [Sarracenia purpurea var. burkii]
MRTQTFQVLQCLVGVAGFKAQVEEGWKHQVRSGAWGGFILQQKLRNLKKIIKDWNQREFSNVDKKVAEFEEELHKLNWKRMREMLKMPTGLLLKNVGLSYGFDLENLKISGGKSLGGIGLGWDCCFGSLGGEGTWFVGEEQIGMAAVIPANAYTPADTPALHGWWLWLLPLLQRPNLRGCDSWLVAGVYD